ncbi:MAG TPA: 5,6-dimethylbenzimidazole synthase [Alphaproteobacteria bacterium]|nr:5,6-dimethylbenzimidazole synthase [Alphaproteobacteria bacterium]
MTGPAFDADFRRTLHDLIAWRRDVRRFRKQPVPAGSFEALVGIASLAPSVGLSQPWRFVLVDDPQRRQAVRDNFARANAEALASYADERARLYATLKLAGLDDAPVQFAVFADRDTPQGGGLGRRTMPEMMEYSAVAAMNTLWLAARAAGLGLGWVSILDPAALSALLDVPPAWKFVGYFCLGYPQTDELTPELERAGWEHRRPAGDFILRR